MTALGGRAAAAEDPPAPSSAPASSPAAQPGHERPPRVGVQGLPYVGVQDFFGKGTDGVGIGARVGVLFGFRFNQLVSANAELSVDFLNVDQTGSRPLEGRDFGSSSHARSAVTTFALSPLFHRTESRVELAAGPKLGVWRGGTGDDQGVLSSAGGYVIGANAGFFVRIGREALLGTFLSFAAMTLSECSGCTSDPKADAIEVFGLTLAALL
jgi:hypothetical protein